MKGKALFVLVAAMLMSAAAFAQVRGDYLDVEAVKVKPERRLEFDAVVKKLVEANRKNNGDRWLTLDTVYGDGDVVSFVSVRGSYADIEKAQGAFLGALNKAYGEAGAEKLFKDFGNTVSGSRSEFRRRRWDLSANVPEDAAGMAKLVGEARWLRTIRIRVKAGRALDVEAELRTIKAAQEKANEKPVTFVSQAEAGQEGTVFYVSWLKSSLSGFDGGPTLKQILGDEAYQAHQKAVADEVQSTETIIYRFVPELSNPPEEVAAVSPDFWRPKPKASVRPKPKAAEAEKAKPEQQQ